MGLQNGITLDRDRAFDINNMNELLTQGKAFIEEIISISKNIMTSIGNISSVYNEIDKEYKVAALGVDINNLIGPFMGSSYQSGSIGATLLNVNYQETIDILEDMLNKLITDIPDYDSRLAQSMDSLQEVLDSVKGRVEDLKGLLTTRDIDLSYEEFKQRLEGIKTGWEATTQDLADLLAEIERDMLGVSVDAVIYSYDPVNLSTGNFVYDHNDIKIGGEIPLSFHRYYNSTDNSKGSMGRCFLHNYEIKLKKEEEKVIITMEDGQRKTFRYKDGIYIGQNSALEELKKVDNEFCLIMQDGYRWSFNEDGYLTRGEDRNEKGITFSHNEEGQLTKVQTDNETFLTYNYNEKGQLIEVIDHTERKVELAYERGKLSTVKSPEGNIYKYNYGKNGRIEETVNPREIVTVKNVYDEKRRITHQTFPDGSSMKFDYEDDKRQVVLTERNESKTIYVHDDKYRNTETIYEDGTREYYEYNSKNQRILYTDRNGNTTRMSYDNRGNLTQVINPLGEKTNLTYNGHNSLISLKVNGKEKLHNSYDTKGNLISSRGADGKENLVTYNEKGRPVLIEEADHSITKLSYDEKGNIVKIQNKNGGEIEYKYDTLNRVIRTLDGNGNATSYEYDEADRIHKVTNPLGDNRSYKYNESGKVTKVTDYDGYSVEATYNNLNKPEAITDKEGNVTHLYYDKMWNVNKVEQADGGIYNYKYDKNNRLKEEQLPEEGCITYEYDGNGNRTKVIDAEGNSIYFTYDALNRIISVKEANDGVIKYEYDEEGNLTTIIDPLNNSTKYYYDEMGRRTKVTNALGDSTTFTYNESGKIEEVIYPNGAKEKYIYKGDLLKEVYKTSGEHLKYNHDKNGNVVSIINGDNNELHYTYDALNRVIAVAAKEGERKFEYDSIGNLKKIIDENGNNTSYEYSPNGNLTKVIDALGNETSYSYDVMGHLITIEQKGDYNLEEIKDNHTTMYEWNKTGQVTKVIDPLGYVERYAYDKNGKMTEKWDKDGYHTAFTYGNTGELTEILYGDGKSVSFTYNALHQLQEMKDWNGTTKIVTDALGRALSVTENDEKTVTYEWRNDGKKLTYPNGKKAEYKYNNRGQLETLETSKGIVKYEYDDRGRLYKKELPNGVTTSYEYNKVGRLARIKHEGEGLYEDYKYQYDAVGNKVQIEKHREGIELDSGKFGYDYDSLNRLTKVTKDDKVLREYNYDTFGNRTIKKEYSNNEESIIQYCYNENNQLISEVDKGIEKQYQYDCRGNMIGESIGEKLIRQFTFDATNKMSSSAGITGDILKKATYEYNGLGQRTGQDIWKVDNQTKGIVDVSVPENPEEKIRYTLDLTREYNNLLSMETEDKNQTFYWDNNVTMMEEDEIGGYYIQDDLGSPMQLIDGEGRSREAYSYDEFGAGDIFENPVQPFGYTGYQMEGAGGLYYAQARRYDAGIGRFISKDNDRFIHFEKSLTLNQYTYCVNSPLRYIDPSGNDCYIFYLPEWENEAENDQRQLADIYGLDESQVHLIEVTDNQSFTDAWNGMGTENGQTVTIDAVVINTHADPCSLQYGDNSDDELRVKNIQALDNKNMDALILYGCNAGHLDYVGRNVASAFAQKVNGVPVFASDGTVYSWITFFNRTNRKYESRNDKSFKFYLLDAENKRKNQGWIIYQYINNSVEVTDGYGKLLNLTTMIDMIHEYKENCTV